MNPSHRKSRSWKELGLPNKIIKALKRSGLSHPTPIQHRAIPYGLTSQDFMAVAPAGTGKTLTYLLPIWNHLDSSQIKVLILIPTRELAFQVSQMLQELNPKLHENCLVIVGGRGIKQQAQKLGSNWKVLIATPGRLLDFLDRDAGLLNKVRILVLDEFDKLLKLGFQEQIEQILKFISGQIHTMWLSATEPDKKDITENLRKAVWINLSSEKKTGSCEEFFYFLKSSKTKNKLCLEELKEACVQSIVFVKNREKANHLNGYFRLNKTPCQMLHGKMKQPERSKIFQNFMDGRISTLIATDLAARGLDTLNVDLIINFDLPQTSADYFHRKGRTGRLDRPGRCLSYAGPEEYLPMRNIEKGLNYPLSCHPDYAQKDKWYINAKARHKKKVKRDQRIEQIKKEQGVI